MFMTSPLAHLDRRAFLALSAALTACGPAPRPVGRPAGASQPSTAAELVRSLLDRIASVDRAGALPLRAVLETNPDALAAAEAADRQQAVGAPLGLLHGLPILIKDNIETVDRMMTTAGSLALEGWYAPADAPLVARLRQAGAIILGKSNLSEWANIRSTHSLSGWSARGGQTRNAIEPLRSPSGSSSGSAAAVAAGLCPLAVGSETDGSIVSPASVNGIVGIKPTVGLVSRNGIIPIAASQDTAGPMARNVADAALLLTVMAGRDPADLATASAPEHVDYRKYVDKDGLKGARLGISRQSCSGNERLNRLLDERVAQLRAAGATLIDPVDLPDTTGLDAAELVVLLHELKDGLNRYLERLPADFRVHTLADIIAFNQAEHAREMPLFGQELFEQAQKKGPLTDTVYRKARARCLQLARGGIDQLVAKHRLDAIVALTNGPAWLIDNVNGDYYTGGSSTPAAVAGYPHITVPATRYLSLPMGLSFYGPAWSEPVLIRLAAGFEAQRTQQT
jgi:amidase